MGHGVRVAGQLAPFSTAQIWRGGHAFPGVIAELRAGDLAFTQVEVDQLLELAGLGGEPVDGRRLRTLTEGWPAGLQMAMLAVRAGGDPREVIDAFAATTRETSDYLASEVMDRLPSDLAGFLMSICVLEEFDAGLCQAVSGQGDAGRLLDRVVAGDLFVLAAAGQRDAEGWLTKVDRAHPGPAPALGALAHAVWAAYHFNRGAVRIGQHPQLAHEEHLPQAGRGLQDRRGPPGRGPRADLTRQPAPTRGGRQ